MCRFCCITSFGRDLKTGNVLVDKDYKLKIADFGYAKLLRKKTMVSKNLYTTLAWTAPEGMEKKIQHNQSSCLILI